MKPFVGSIESITEINTAFRRVLFTGKHMQLVLMSLRPHEEIGYEVHPRTDQFFRIEKGRALFVLDRAEKIVGPGWAVVVPAGTHHNIINISKTKTLKLYTLYAPPKHPAGTLQMRKPSDPGLETWLPKRPVAPKTRR